MNTVSISQQECRKIMLDILSAIADVCGKCNIPYYLAGGTLLGAVRHQGFIPWDDDIDIFLKHEDYPKVLEALRKQTEYRWLSVLDESVDGYYYPFAKVVDNRTIAKAIDSATSHGIWVDVFPLNNVPSDAKKRKQFARRCQYLRAIILSMVTDFASLRWEKKTILKKILHALACSIGKKRISNIAIKYMTRYNRKETGYVCITWTPYGGEYIETGMMDHIKEYKFEDRTYTGFANYDIYLKRAYGKYMELPPLEEQRTHDITAWWLPS
ncbi:LicD family protein [Phocaeicola sp.]